MISQETLDKIFQFRKDRDWEQFHNAKDLAISLNLEAAELLECFQWTGKNVEPKDIEAAKQELADIIIYAVYLAKELNCDPEEIVLNKLKENNKKYPVEKAKGNSDKYTKLNEQ